MLTRTPATAPAFQPTDLVTIRNVESCGSTITEAAARVETVTPVPLPLRDELGDWLYEVRRVGNGLGGVQEFGCTVVCVAAEMTAGAPEWLRGAR